MLEKLAFCYKPVLLSIYHLQTISPSVISCGTYFQLRRKTRLPGHLGHTMTTISLPTSFLPSFLSNLSSTRPGDQLTETNAAATSETTLRHEAEAPDMPPIDSNRVRLSPSGRQPSRPRTTFSFNHPPPRTKSKKRLKLRPRLLLQIHQVPDHGRSFPVLDVFQSTMMGKRFTRNHRQGMKGMERIGVNDLIIVSSDSYLEDDSGDDGHSSGEDEKWNDKDVVAIVRQQDGQHFGSADLSLNRGGHWQAAHLPSGAYDFASKDNSTDAMRVRWVPRNRMRRPNPTSPDEDKGLDKRFTFSIINAESRRHPVIATMTKRGIEIVDRYQSTISASPSASEVSSPMSPESSSSYFEESELYGQHSPMIETNESLRSLIVMTGIWVALMQDWSTNFSSHDFMDSNTQRSIAQLNKKPRVSSLSMMESMMDGVRPKRPMSLVSQAHTDTEVPRCPTSSVPCSENQPFARPVRETQQAGKIRRSFSAGPAFMERLNQKGAAATIQGPREHKTKATTSPGPSQRLEVPARAGSRLFRRKKTHSENDITMSTKSPRPGRQNDTVSQASTQPSTNDSELIDERSTTSMIKRDRTSESTRGVTTVAVSQPSPGRKSAKAQLKRWSGLHFFSHSSSDI